MPRSNLPAIALAVALCALAGCAPKTAPVSISRCDVLVDPHGATLEARVTSHAPKPVGKVHVQLDFYHSYNFTRTTAALAFSPVLDPGTTRDVSARLELSGNPGPVMRCVAASVVYGDGTTAP
jgi:hypothetical protein